MDKHHDKEWRKAFTQLEDSMADLSPDEIKEVMEYIATLKSKRAQAYNKHPQ